MVYCGNPAAAHAREAFVPKNPREVLLGASWAWPELLPFWWGG